jgi:predicted metal-dependent TIM-barrel fold hydrolase
MLSRVTDDYERMAMSGVVAVLEPAFWLGQPRTSVGSFIDYFDSILGWERFRAESLGVRHYVTLALNPKEANDDRVNRAVLDILPRYLEKDGVVGVGEVGYDDITDKEEFFFEKQVELAKQKSLPVLVHTPHRDKTRGVERSLGLLKNQNFPLEKALIDHNNEETVPLVVDKGCAMGFSIYPDTKMDEARMVLILQKYGTDRMILNSACDWGRSDPLKVPKTALLMRRAGFSEKEIEKVVWHNPVNFFAQSGRLDLAELDKPIEAASQFQGNSILRGTPWR